MMAFTLGLVLLTFTLHGVFSAVLTLPQVRLLCHFNEETGGVMASFIGVFLAVLINSSPRKVTLAL
jgi:hypothetical protein